MAIPVLIYECECWALKERDERRIQGAKIRFLKRIKDCSRLDHTRNEEVRNDLSIYFLNG